MRRRIALGLIGSALIYPVWAQDKAKKLVRLGFLSNFTAAGGKEPVGCFIQALAGLGWTEGKNLSVEYRWAGGKSENYARFAAELIAMNLDIIAVNSTPAAQAMRRATSRTDGLPVVFMSVSDPVDSGIVDSIARPGANITGFSNFFPAYSAKLVEIIKNINPRISTAVVIRDAANAGKTLDTKEIQLGGQKIGVDVVDGGVRSTQEIKERFLGIERTRPDALIVLVDGVTLSNRELIVELVAKANIPTIYQVRDFVDAGGLISYGLNFCKHFARAATYVDKILKGAKPADLPIELPSQFELVVNLRAAKSLNLTVPPTVLVSADEVIE